MFPVRHFRRAGAFRGAPLIVAGLASCWFSGRERERRSGRGLIATTAAATGSSRRARRRRPASPAATPRS